MIDVNLIAARDEARDIRLLELASPCGGVLPSAEPGAHIDLQLPGNIVRQYSLTNVDLHPRKYVIGVKRDPASRGGSKFVFDQLRVGHALRISTPRNNFRLLDGVSPVVLIAGGIGITPIWAMVQQLTAMQRRWELHYSCRSRSDMAFLGELQHLPHAKLHFDDERQGQLLDLAAIVGSAPDGATYYCCGPQPMLAAFERATSALPPSRVHLERFAPAEPPSARQAFDVVLKQSGRILKVPVGRTILSVLLEEGIAVDYSCELGVCGVCETRVLEGVPNHRDSVLTPEERQKGNTMMVCCSGCKGDRLVLDL